MVSDAAIAGWSALLLLVVLVVLAVVALKMMRP